MVAAIRTAAFRQISDRALAVDRHSLANLQKLIVPASELEATDRPAEPAERTSPTPSGRSSRARFNGQNP